MVCEIQAAPSILSTFTVYAYIPWKKNLTIESQNISTDYSDELLKYGIQAIKVIYANSYTEDGKVSIAKKKMRCGLHASEKLETKRKYKTIN